MELNFISKNRETKTPDKLETPRNNEKTTTPDKLETPRNNEKTTTPDKLETPHNFEKTALIIDDSKVNQMLLDVILQSLGYKTFHAEDGEDGISQFVSVKPVITFLDIVMPKKTGLEVLKEIKLHNPKAVVIMVSSFTTKENIHEAKRSAANGFLKKPISNDKVQQIVQSVEKKLAHV